MQLMSILRISDFINAMTKKNNAISSVRSLKYQEEDAAKAIDRASICVFGKNTNLLLPIATYEKELDFLEKASFDKLISLIRQNINITDALEKGTVQVEMFMLKPNEKQGDKKRRNAEDKRDKRTKKVRFSHDACDKFSFTYVSSSFVFFSYFYNCSIEPKTTLICIYSGENVTRQFFLVSSFLALFCFSPSYASLNAMFTYY